MRQFDNLAMRQFHNYGNQLLICMRNTKRKRQGAPVNGEWWCIGEGVFMHRYWSGCRTVLHRLKYGCDAAVLRYCIGISSGYHRDIIGTSSEYHQDIIVKSSRCNRAIRHLVKKRIVLRNDRKCPVVFELPLCHYRQDLLSNC
jgi:hypothetical protein